MHFKKRIFLFLSFLLFSCGPRIQLHFFLGETATLGPLNVTFESYHITPIDENNFCLDYTLHINVKNEEPYQLQIKDTGVRGWIDPNPNSQQSYSEDKWYTCNIEKNIAKNGYDIFSKEDYSGDYSYTFFIDLPNTIYEEQGTRKEVFDHIQFSFMLFSFSTCTLEYFESVKNNTSSLNASYLVY